MNGPMVSGKNRYPFWQGSSYETNPKHCTMHYYKGNPKNCHVFVLFDAKKTWSFNDPCNWPSTVTIWMLFTHFIEVHNQPIVNFQANCINTAPNLFVTLPFEKKKLAAKKIRLLDPTGQHLAKLHKISHKPKKNTNKIRAFEGFKSSFFMGGIR